MTILLPPMSNITANQLIKVTERGTPTAPKIKTNTAQRAAYKFTALIKVQSTLKPI